MKNKKAFEEGVRFAIKNGHKGLLDRLGIDESKWEHSLDIMEAHYPKKGEKKRHE